MEKEHFSKRIEDRKRILNTDCHTWPDDVCENAVYKTNITIENELFKRLCDEVQKVDFINATQVINILFYWPDRPVFNELKEKLSAFPNINDLFLLKQDPFEQLWPHKDMKVDQTVFYLPLLPLKPDYAPFEVYYNNEQYGVVPQEKNNIFITDSRITHGIFNNEHTRYNIQYRIDQPYKETYKILKKQGL